MTAPPALAPLLESFFRHRLAKQRNATAATISCYRDALRLLILFAARRSNKKPAALVLEDLDRDLVLAFLDELEETRKNSISTRNARLTAIRSFFHHVAANNPASFGVANRILTIPIKRAHVEVTHHLTGAEVDALIDAPDQREPRGRRDRAFLLFLARTGARVSEAIGANAADLQLARPRSQVLLRGKGRKERMVPIPPDLLQALTALMKERKLANHEASPLFVGTHDDRNSFWGDTHCTTRRRHRYGQPAGARAQDYFTSRLQALARHEASPIGRRSPDHPGLAGAFTGRHHAPLRRRRR